MTLVVCFLSFHYVLVYFLNFHYVLVYLLNYEFVDVWFLSQLYLKLRPEFNSILVAPLASTTPPWFPEPHGSRGTEALQAPAAVRRRDVPHALHHPVHGPVGIVPGVLHLAGCKERRRPAVCRNRQIKTPN